MTYVKGRAEDMPFEDGVFDAIISVNAIDHVDDIGQSAREISRVLAPGGIVRLEAHYHRPSKLEPHSLSDDTMIRYFGHLGVRKVGEKAALERQRVGEGHVDEFEEKLSVWAND